LILGFLPSHILGGEAREVKLGGGIDFSDHVVLVADKERMTDFEIPASVFF